jgi:hypothetical protein
MCEKELNIDEHLQQDDLFLVKFDNIESKYNYYIDKINYKVINITDSEIIEFYDIEKLPTILIYKNKTLIDKIEGFLPKTQLLSLISNNIK